MPRRQDSPAAPLLPLQILIIVLSTIALILLLSLLSSSSHILRPISVKTGWDSLNVLLVLFAVLCGIFARQNDDEPIADEGNTTTSYTVDQKTSRNAVSNEWIDDRYDSTTPASGTGRLKRNSSSYRDLRQYSVGGTGDNLFRFFDDFDLSKYRSAEVDILNFHGHRRQESEIQDEPKEIPVDTFVVCSSFSPPTSSKSPALEPPPLPPPPPLPARYQKARRAYRPVGHQRKVENSSDQCDTGFEAIKSPPPALLPPPQPRPRPSPSTAMVETEQKYSKSGRNMGNARKEIKMALASLYSRRKRLTRKNLPDDYFDHASEEPVYYTRPPPSPPPPPPLPSVFHNLFKKGTKSKRNNSWSAPPTPPPPPPRSSKPKKNQTPTPPRKAPSTPPPQSSRRRPGGTTRRPPLPTRTDHFYDETTNNGGQSPLIPMPSPSQSPPPPFEMLKTKFVIRGDNVRIRSTHNSRCSSPESDDLYVSSSKGNPDTVNKMDGEDRVTGPAFCPSPDVNVKADAFIARLRDGWRLEKMNSVKENHNLARGPGPIPSPSPSMRW